jgi:hypothetical protein
MKKEAGFVFVIILFSSLALAEISLSEPLETYNLGDRLYVTVSGIKGINSGNFNIDLVCGNRTINLAKFPARAFPSDKESVYELPFKVLDEEDLEIANITDILGNCQIIASIGANAVSTKSFVITNNVFVTLSLNKNSYNPNEAITIKINAVKANGDLINGFAEVSEATYFSKAIENGYVMNTFSLSETLEAGIYYLNVSVYDVGSRGKLNKGSARISFEINQVASSLVLSLSDNEATPGEKFTIGAEVFDQSGKKMNGGISGKLISPLGEEREIVMKSGEFVEVDFPTNATSGIWKLRVFYNIIGEEREIVMKELQKVDMNIEGSVLVVKNVGNTLYNKTINIQIGNTTKELNLNIEMGETRKFNLAAPKGEYKVLIGDGGDTISHQVLLTGKAISINDLDEGIFKDFFVLWIFLIIIFGGVGIILLRRSQKTKTIDESTEKKGLSKKIVNFLTFSRFRNRNKINSEYKIRGEGKPVKQDKKVVDLTSSKLNSAESALVLKGEKYPSAVIAISIKNYNNLSSSSKDSLIKIIREINIMKGLIDWKGDYIFVIFSPIATRTYANEVLASKVAFKIWDALSNYNKKFREKIEFNIGVNSGDLVASKSGEKIEYTGIGNTISLAKRISDSDSGNVLISESVRKRGIRDLVVKKIKNIGDNPIYAISNIKDREANETKLKDLLKRGDMWRGI